MLEKTQSLPFNECMLADKLLRIRTIVGADFGVGPKILLCYSNKTRWVWAKSIAIYLSYDLTCCSCAQLGRHFGNTDHTSVLYHLRKVRRQFGNARFIAYLWKLEMRILKS